MSVPCRQSSQRRCRKHLRAAGQALTEFVLVCPVLLFVALGLFELNMYQLDAYRTQDAAIAACDAASEAATGGDAQSLAAAAVASSAAASNLHDATLVSLAGLPGGPAGTGSAYFCTVQATHPILSTTFANQVGWSVTLQARAAGAISGRNPG